MHNIRTMVCLIMDWFRVKLNPRLVVIAFFVTHMPSAISAEGRLPFDIGQFYDRLPTPYCLDTAKTSGPVCLYFLDCRLGGQRDYEAIVEICQPGRTGTTMDQLAAATSELGYSSFAFRSGVAALKRLKSPAIIGLRYDNQLDMNSHRCRDRFVAILGWDDREDRFIVFDPPRNIQYYSSAELTETFSGIGLAINKTPLDAVSTFERRPHRVFPFVFGFASIMLLWRVPRISRAATPPLLLSLLLFVVVGCGRNSSDPHRHDAGQLPVGTMISHTFQVENRSTTPLKYMGISGDCGCSTSIIRDAPVLVPPGGSSDAIVQIDTSGFDGPTERKFVVQTNSTDPAFKAIALSLRVDSATAFQQLPECIYFGPLGSFRGAEELFEFRLGQETLANNLKVKTNRAWVKASVGKTNEKWVTLRVAIASVQKPTGCLLGDVILTFDDADQKQAEVVIPVVARIGSDLEIVPDRISLSNLNTLSGPRRQKVRLRYDAEEFRIIGVDCPPHVVARILNSDLASTHFVELSIGAAAEIGVTPIILHTDLASHPIIHLHVTP